MANVSVIAFRIVGDFDYAMICACWWFNRSDKVASTQPFWKRFWLWWNVGVLFGIFQSTLKLTWKLYKTHINGEQWLEQWQHGSEWNENEKQRKKREKEHIEIYKIHNWKYYNAIWCRRLHGWFCLFFIRLKAEDNRIHLRKKRWKMNKKTHEDYFKRQYNWKWQWQCVLRDIS